MLAFDPDFSRPEFNQWKLRVKHKLHELMRFPELESSSPAPRVIDTKAYADYTLHRVEVYPEPFSVVPVLLLMPNTSGKKPAVLCIAGSSGTKEMLCKEPELDGRPTRNKHPERNCMAWHFVKAGFVAAAIEHPGVGELTSPDRAEFPQHISERDGFSAQMLMMGRHYPGLCTFQGLEILKWLKGLHEVDRARIAVSGHSLGTEPGMFLAVLDDEVQALVFNDFIGDNRERIVATKPPESPLYATGMWHCIPDFFRWFAFPDILASYAPKPLIITEGGVTNDIKKIKHAYATSGAPDNVCVHYYEKYKDKRDRLYDDAPLPEGLSKEEYLRYANVDPDQHYFKGGLAIPWLQRIFGCGAS